MARHNHPRHSGKTEERYDIGYAHLPEYPQLRQIIGEPTKTIYINLDADCEADGTHVAHGFHDPILRRIVRRKAVEG